MVTTFARSPRGTLGLEWELALVDRATGELVNEAPALLPELERRWASDGTAPHATAELLQNTVEIVSAPHSRVRDALTDLQRLATDVLELADARGLDVIAPGCHPFSSWATQQVTDSTRYRAFMDTNAWWGRNMLIWGVHTHVGVDRVSRVIPIMHALIAYQPHLIALSASSPFWEGHATGYASNRTMLFQQLSSAGVPFEIETWEQFDEVLEHLRTAGIISEASEARWDVRPAPKWGTLEVRTCDGASTLTDLGAMAALTQCLVEDFARRMDRGEPVPRLQQWFVRENKWRAARYGLDAQVIHRNDGSQAALWDLLQGACERLAPIAEDLGCAAELAHAAAMVRSRQTSTERQLAVYAEHTGAPVDPSAVVAGASPAALRAVVRSLAAEFRNSVTGSN